MLDTRFAEHLARYGPDRAEQLRPTLPQAQAYCRQLAQSTYENFTVASRLLPAELRQHFYHVYAYCRWADNLADETTDPAISLALLDWWETELDRCYQKAAEHPVFVALAETIDEFDIPAEPFRDLLVAFRQDQRQTRYDDFDELLGYCRNSANPVGRLVLYLGRSHDAECASFSDAICTGLQLANFCQDVARDWDRGRIYLPRASWQAAGYDEACFSRRETSDVFRRMLAAEVARAEGFLRQGLPLVQRVPRALRVDIDLFARGGLAVLEGIRRIGYDVWRKRPTVSKWDQVRLLIGCWWRNAMFRPQGHNRQGGRA